MRIREGDPLEIYTDRDGEVIFKKYSPIGEWSQIATQYAETLNKTCGLSVIICDRDAIIAAAGVSKREYSDRRLTPEFEELMENRSLYSCGNGERIFAIDGGSHYVSCAMPIVSDGDIIGCVASLSGESTDKPADFPEAKLIQTAASFLGRQTEA